MCPNCILNQSPLDTGLYIAFGVCVIFFIMAVWAMWWAIGNGEFEDIESTKFDMLDDSENGNLAGKARQAVEKVREAKQNG
ncbi:cbb3-type cytochrome oxidase assembly protein CcoS [bacterium]|nr:cbb3-type cytochrome oxidase assembly protein CcoS [bacterium]